MNKKQVTIICILCSLISIAALSLIRIRAAKTDSDPKILTIWNGQILVGRKIYPVQGGYAVNQYYLFEITVSGGVTVHVAAYRAHLGEIYLVENQLIMIGYRVYKLKEIHNEEGYAVFVEEVELYE